MNIFFKYILGSISTLLTLFGIYYLFVLYVTLVGEDDGFRFAYVFSPLSLTFLAFVGLSLFAGVHFISKPKK